MAAMLVFSGVLAVASWLFGLVQFTAMSPKKIASLVVAAAAIGAASSMVFPLEARSGESKVEASNGIDWKPWSEEAVEAALAEGRPVFVDFTADWCLTCKVNEKNAIDTDSVREAIATYDVATFKADWTNPDERIREKLAEFGQAGVPFYLVYSPAPSGRDQSDRDQSDRAEPLGEVITAESLVEAFEDAAGDL
jgi:thiol:disulfide interchange protein DsbD